MHNVKINNIYYLFPYQFYLKMNYKQIIKPIHILTVKINNHMDQLPQTNIFNFYIVGGYVRDKLLSRENNDIDYVITINTDKLIKSDLNGLDHFQLLHNYLTSNNYTIIQTKPEHLCIKAKNLITKQVNDFVLARKDISYPPDSRLPVVAPGTLYDDLMRRDFTINTLALNVATNNIVDVCGGQDDLLNGILRTPLDSKITLLEDPLRVLRGFRFSVVLDFTLSEDFMDTVKDSAIWNKFCLVVNHDRIREELNKMFAHDIGKTLGVLQKIKELNIDSYNYILDKLTIKVVQKNC